MLFTLPLYLLPILLTSAAAAATPQSLPSSIVIIVPPNDTVVSEDIAYGASFTPDFDTTTHGYSSRIQIALTHPNGTQTAPSTVHDRACSDTPPPVLGGFNTGGLNFSQRSVPDVPGVYTIDVSVRFGFPPAGSRCAEGNEEFQFRNSSASFQVQPLPAGASSSILIGTAFEFVTQTFVQPTGVVEGGNNTAASTHTVGSPNGTSGSGPIPTPTGGARAAAVSMSLAVACVGGAFAVSMW